MVQTSSVKGHENGGKWLKTAIFWLFSVIFGDFRDILVKTLGKSSMVREGLKRVQKAPFSDLVS